MSKRRPRSAAGLPPYSPRTGTNGHAPGTLRGGGHRASLTWAAARRATVFLLAASFALSVLFAATLPLDANPDEAAHRDYIRLMIAERGFVKFQERGFDQPPPAPGAPVYYETHQPPLYYLLCLPVHALTGGSVFAVRLVAAVLNLLTVLVVFRAGRDLFPDRAELALGAAAFAAFLPTQAQLGGAINNDALTTLVCAALFWRMGLLVVGGQDLRGAVVTGALLGAGLLTKSSALTLLPSLLLAYGIAVRARLMDGRRVATCLSVALGIAVLIASPWLMRNARLYGDPLALSIYTSTGPNYSPRQVMEGFGWAFGDYVRNVAVRSFATFWYFLSPNLPPNRFIGPPAPLLLALALGLGGLLGTLRWILRDQSSEPGQRRAVGLFLGGIILLAPFFARFVLTVFQAQGRYFLPALLPVAVVTCLGWASLVAGAEGSDRKDRRRVVGALGVGAILLLMTFYALVHGGFFA